MGEYCPSAPISESFLSIEYSVFGGLLGKDGEFHQLPDNFFAVRRKFSDCERFSWRYRFFISVSPLESLSVPRGAVAALTEVPGCRLFSCIV